MRLVLSSPLLLGSMLVSVFATTWIVFLGAAQNPFHFMDLSVYRAAINAWWSGQHLYVHSFPNTGGGLLPFVYPPFGALLLTPLVMLPWPMACAASVAFSLVCLVGVLCLITRQVWPEVGWRGVTVVTSVFLPFSLFLAPVRDTLWFGQVNIVLMYLVVADLLVKDPKWPRGLLIGIAAAVKITPGGFLLLLLLRRDFRAALTSVVTMLGTIAVGFPASWQDSVHFWFGWPGGRTELTTAAVGVNQTINGALLRMNIPPSWEVPLWVLLSVMLLVLAIATMRSVLRWEMSTALPIAVLINAGAILAISPMSWGHHWVYIVPMLVVSALHAVRHWWEGAGLFVVFAASFMLAPQKFAPLRPSDIDDKMHWSFVEHVYGNTYVLLLAVVLVGLFLRGRLARRSE